MENWATPAPELLWPLGSGARRSHARPEAGALLLHGGHLATFLREFSAGLTPPIGNANSGEVSMKFAFLGFYEVRE